MGALEVPGDPLGTQKVGSPELQDLLNGLTGELARMPVGDGPPFHKAFCAIRIVRLLPAIVRRTGDLELAARLPDVTHPFGVLEDRHFPLDCKRLTYSS